ncbi:MAG: LLM class flavin-dependent oxidoreductase [Promethearchaeota archaeon]
MTLNFGIGLPTSRPATEIISLAMETEKYGFHRIWIGDHYHSRNPFLLLTAIGAQTNQIQLCTGITNPFHLSSAVLASTALSLNELSNGRFLLGLGVGDELTLKQIDMYPQKPVTAVRQCVTAIRDLWNGKTVSSYVNGFQWHEARLRINQQDHISIYLGAQGAGMAQLAFEIADGLIMNASSPVDYRWLSSVGKSPLKDFETVAYFIVELTNSPSSYLKQLVAQIIAGASRSMLTRHNIAHEDANRIKQLVQKRRRQEINEMVTNQMIDSFSVVGARSEIEERIEELRKERVSGFIFGGPLALDHRIGIQLLSELIKSF